MYSSLREAEPGIWLGRWTRSKRASLHEKCALWNIMNKHAFFPNQIYPRPVGFILFYHWIHRFFSRLLLIDKLQNIDVAKLNFKISTAQWRAKVRYQIIGSYIDNFDSEIICLRCSLHRTQTDFHFSFPKSALSWNPPPPQINFAPRQLTPIKSQFIPCTIVLSYK